MVLVPFRSQLACAHILGVSVPMGRISRPVERAAKKVGTEGGPPGAHSSAHSFIHPSDGGLSMSKTLL